MITVQSAQELQVEGQLPQLLEVMSFSHSNPLWLKEKENTLINKIQSNEKYEYFKIGKIFGLEITRYIAIVQNKLVYFQEIETNEFIGYCSLINLYVQWVTLKRNRFLLILSNGTQTSHLYFSSDRFWIDQQKNIEQYGVSVDFYQKYTIIEGLGEGNFSKVYKVKCKQNGNVYAAKITSKNNDNRSIAKMTIQERNNLLSLKDNANLCEFQSFYETNSEYIILMDYIYGKDLMTFIKMKRALTIENMKLILCNILLGINECHKKKIIHRDIKPQNIIINIHTFSLKIIDFGLSINLQQQCSAQDFKKCGTLGYMAPEVINCYNTTIYNEKCDIFSFGIIAHTLLMGYNPLRGRFDEQTEENNRICNIKLQQPQIISKYGDNGLFFLKKLLCIEQCIRYSAEQALFSSFLRQNSNKSEQLYFDCRTTTQQEFI